MSDGDKRSSDNNNNIKINSSKRPMYPSASRSRSRSVSLSRRGLNRDDRRSHPSGSRSRHGSRRSRSRSRSTSRNERKYGNRPGDRRAQDHDHFQMRSRRNRSQSPYGREPYVRREGRSYSHDRYRQGYDYEYERPPSDYHGGGNYRYENGHQYNHPTYNPRSSHRSNYGPPDEYPPAQHPSESREGLKRRSDDGPPSVSLLVRNISMDVTVSDLRGAFSRLGELRDVYIPIDYHSQKPKGFAFIEYVRPEDARLAQEEMHHFVIKGKRMEVVFAQERRKTPGEMKYKVESHRTRDNDRIRSDSYQKYHGDRNTSDRR